MTRSQLSKIIKWKTAQTAFINNVKDSDKRASLRAEFNRKYSTKRYWNVERCLWYLNSVCGNPERCVNYILFYDGLFYVKLDWAAKINLPNQCYWHDGGREFIQLTPFGVNWVLDYLLHRIGVLVVRNSSLKARGGVGFPERIR